ncbi:MAG: NfeD family protein [Pseudomonadota bacterium]
MVWWHWLVVGLALAAAELINPGTFFLLFLGLAGLLVGTILGFGVPLPTWAQVLVFCMLSVGSLALFRSRLRRRVRGVVARDVGDIVGEIAVPLEDIAVGSTGKVELRGTSWTGRADEVALHAGQRCHVVRVDGLMLWLRPE